MNKDVFHRIKECKLTRNLKHNEPSAPVHTHFVKPIINNDQNMQNSLESSSIRYDENINNNIFNLNNKVPS
jgi:hypothetical protein